MGTNPFSEWRTVDPIFRIFTRFIFGSLGWRNRLSIFAANSSDLNSVQLFANGADLSVHDRAIDWPLVIGACISAFAGAYVGAKVLKKVTFRSVQLIVSALLIVVGVGLIVGAL